MKFHSDFLSCGISFANFIYLNDKHDMRRGIGICILSISLCLGTVSAQEQKTKYEQKIESLFDGGKYGRSVNKLERLKKSRRKNKPPNWVLNFYLAVAHHGSFKQTGDTDDLSRALKAMAAASRRGRLAVLKQRDSVFVRDLRNDVDMLVADYYGKFDKPKARYYARMLRKVFEYTSIYYYPLTEPKNTSAYSIRVRPDDTLLFPLLFMEELNRLRQTGCRCGDTEMPKAKPLKWSEDLARLARYHSKDMHRHKYFSHKDRNGLSPYERAKILGVKGVAGENIHVGSYSERGAFNGWKGSPGHCRNMMRANLRLVGLGRSGTYWTLVLGR